MRERERERALKNAGCEDLDSMRIYIACIIGLVRMILLPEMNSMMILISKTTNIEDKRNR